MMEVSERQNRYSRFPSLRIEVHLPLSVKAKNDDPNVLPGRSMVRI
jgi:hypothetical protein